ncbi:hypothetical protein D3C72_2094720 [compost metagenome]
MLKVGHQRFGLDVVSLLQPCGERLQAVTASGDEQQVIAAPGQAVGIDGANAG